MLQISMLCISMLQISMLQISMLNNSFRNVVLVVVANLRRGKSQALSLLAFVLIAALLLNIGLLLMLRFGDYYDKRAEELNAPHYVLVEDRQLYTQAQVDYLKNYRGVTQVETEEALVSARSSIPYNNGSIIGDLIFLNTHNTRGMNDLLVVEGAPPLKTNEICLPFLFKVGGGYALGDDFIITYAGQTYDFKVCGFTEEIMFGASNFQIFQTYVSPAGYDNLQQQAPSWESMILRARMENPAASEQLNLDFLKKFAYQADFPGMNTLYILSVDLIMMKAARTMMSGVTSAIMLVFAVLIVLVSLLVVRFRINNSIEEGMTNLGALKSVGYTGKQLLWATVLQFCLIAALGTAIGIGISYALMPAVGGVLEAQTALVWKQGFDVPCSLLAFLFILVLVFFVTIHSAWRIRSLTPLAALRQGLNTHSMKKNYFPLNRSRGPLTWLLALKSILQAKGQMATIFVIVAAVSLMAAAGVSIYANIGLQPDKFGKLLSGEIPDAAFFIKNPEDTPRVKAYIESQANTRKAFNNTDTFLMLGDIQVVNIVVEDFSLLEGSLLYEGRYPRHSNEIVIGGRLSDIQGKNIGGSIRIALGTRTADYLIVGLIQTVNNGGFAISMSEAGFLRIQEDYAASELYVYLHDSTQTAALIDSVQKTFPAELESSVNLWELMDAQLSVYGTIFQVVAIAILVVTLLVILMTLYLMLKTVILRRRRTLGIQKAMGFTTPQLMNQLSLHFIPIIALGVAAGGLCGILGFNSMFVALSRNMGIMTASMPAPIGLTVAMCAGLVLVAYVFAMLIAWRIRKVSAYGLVSE
jgi:putative ABC transport system permease protein